MGAQTCALQLVTLLCEDIESPAARLLCVAGQLGYVVCETGEIGLLERNENGSQGQKLRSHNF